MLFPVIGFVFRKIRRHVEVEAHVLSECRRGKQKDCGNQQRNLQSQRLHINFSCTRGLFQPGNQFE
jgi:hypothetical protein